MFRIRFRIFATNVEFVLSVTYIARVEGGEGGGTLPIFVCSTIQNNTLIRALQGLTQNTLNMGVGGVSF